MHRKRRTITAWLSIALTGSTWLAVAACETPPSAYIPPVEPHEVPNVDPPPGIPVMPSGSAASKAPDAGGGGATTLITGPICKSDKDCAVTTRTACCSAGDPRAVLRTEVDNMEKDCKDERCIDVELKGDPTTAKDYFAKCANKSCSLVKKKKKGK